MQNIMPDAVGHTEVNGAVTLLISLREWEVRSSKGREITLKLIRMIRVIKGELTGADSLQLWKSRKTS